MFFMISLNSNSQISFRPCRVQPGGNSTELNPHSWTEYANMIFFDQPVQAGFSYSDSGLPSTPLNAASASVDTHAFLQLFFSRFPKLASKPFHIAGESWGGQFIPHMAATIHQRNLAVENSDHAEWKQINLKSILMGNGLTDALHQFPKLAEYLCEGPYAILAPDSKECNDLAQTAIRCQKMVQACYDYNNPLVCTPAEQVCWRMMQPVVGELHSSISFVTSNSFFIDIFFSSR
jgi:cathepsin A (carboxypeptidase C)